MPIQNGCPALENILVFGSSLIGLLIKSSPCPIIAIVIVGYLLVVSSALN
jgi:hypothetical protein